MKKILSLVSLLLVFTTISAFADSESPKTVDGATTVDTAQAKELFDSGVLFVDTRKDSDWEAGRIPDAVHLELKSKYNEASLSAVTGKDESLVFYCNGHECNRSSASSAKAVEWGFSKVYYYRDGFPAWKAAGHPVE